MIWKCPPENRGDAYLFGARELDISIYPWFALKDENKISVDLLATDLQQYGMTL